MNFRKHMPRLILCLLMALLVCSTALAADTDHFIFEQNGDSCTVVAYTGSASEVRVPDWYNGLPVTRIGPSAFEGNSKLTTLMLPSSIIRIGAGAFRNCARLTTISTYTAHTEHIWDEGVVAIPATCAQEGLMIHTCTLCPTQKAEPIPVSEEHAWDEGVVTRQPTCAMEGVTTFSCTVCSKTRTEPIPVTDEHVWDEGVITKEPSETETGLKVYTCTLCGTTRDEILPVVSSRIPGDVNDDGGFNLLDILVLIQYNCGNPNVTPNLANADVNADNAVNLLDILVMIQYNCGNPNVTLK